MQREFNCAERAARMQGVRVSLCARYVSLSNIVWKRISPPNEIHMGPCGDRRYRCELGPGRVLFGFLLLPLFLPGMKAAASQPQRQRFLGEEPGWFDTMFPRMTRIKKKKIPAATTLALNR